MTADDHIPARPHYLELDLPDGPQRVYLGHFHNDGKPTPPPEKWRQICQCQKNYVPCQGAPLPRMRRHVPSRRGLRARDDAGGRRRRR